MSSTENFLANQPVSDTDREFWQFVSEHRDFSGEVERRLREADRNAEVERRNLAKRLRAAVRKIILAALKGEVDRKTAATELARQVLETFYWQPRWESKPELWGQDEPKFFGVAADIAIEIDKSQLRLDDARLAVESILIERRIGLPAGIFGFHPEKIPARESEEKIETPTKRPALNHKKIEAYTNPRLLTATWQSDDEQRWPALLPELKHMATNFDLENGLPNGKCLQWYDPLEDVGGVGPITLIAHVLKIPVDDAALRLANFVSVFASVPLDDFVRAARHD